ncbi:sodium channel protein type 7 subunit alpha-like isoform X2 [Oscarella lobularis]|uniref:sodium channel protein type 7 subunit alpha-like isoform X2 n=1 Tax=Oscarella lobularis TaxID=121494 RepID=UPI00331435E7
MSKCLLETRLDSKSAATRHSSSRESIISMEVLPDEDTTSTATTRSEIPKVRSFLSKKSPEKKEKEQRSLLRRSSVENFGRFGLLTPALALLPSADGQDELTKRFEDLQGEHRELVLAAAHIEDALKGRGRYGKARAMFKPKYAQRCFHIINNKWFHRLIFFTVVLHSFLVFGERPSVQKEHPSVIVLNAVCLLVYVLDITLTIVFMNWNVFWTLKETVWNRGEFVLLILFSIDFVIQIAGAITGEYYIRVFRCLRATMLFCKAKNIRHIFGVLVSILVKLGKVFAGIALFILVFAAIGLHVFMDEYQCAEVNSTVAYNNTNFTSAITLNNNNISCLVSNSTDNVYCGAYNNLLIAALRLFVLLTTENYPDLFLPAWDDTKLSWFFYGAFIYIGVFILTAILLAIIVDAYWTFAKVHVKEERAREREELAKAWNLLDPIGIGDLPRDDPKFAQLFRILKPNNSDEENRELIYSIDTEMDGFIDSWQWTTNLREVLLAEFEKENEDIIPNAACVKHLKAFAKRLVENPRFGRFIVLLIFIHSVLFCLKWKGMTSAVELGVQIPRTVIVGFFFFEMLLRAVGWGSLEIRNYAEIIDAVLVFLSLGANVAWYADVGTRAKGILIVVSSLCVLLRLGFNPPELKKLVVNTAVSFGTILWDLTVLYLVTLYFFSVIGLEAFHRERASAQVVETYDILEYGCNLGYEDFRCSLLMTFQITTSNNWNDIMNAAMETAGSAAAIYFVFTYSFINLIVMNLFVTLVIEGFNKFSALSAETSRSKEDEEMTTWKKVKAFFAMLLGSSKVSPSDDDDNYLPKSPSFQPGNSATRIKSRSGSQRNSVEMRDFVRPSPKRSTERLSYELRRDEEDEENEDDLFGLSAVQKREARMKRKFQKKRRKLKSFANKTLNIVRVMMAFKSTKDSEISLNEGEEVEVLEELSDVGWMKGKKKTGEVGWFPVKHVTRLSEENGKEKVKVKIVYHPESNGNDSKPPPSPLPGLNSSGVVPNTPISETPVFNFVPSIPRSSGSVSDIRQPSSLTPGHTKSKKLVKSSGASDWRRGILGEMTVMNPDEMKRLNAVLKKEMRDRTGRGNRNRTSLSNMPISVTPQPEPLPGVTEESLSVRAPNPLASRSSPSLTNSSHSGLSSGGGGGAAKEVGVASGKSQPSFNVQPFISVETITDNNALKEVDEEEEDDAFQATSGSVGGDTLTVPGLPQPPKKTNKAKPTGGGGGGGGDEIPDWVRRFQQEHAIEVKMEEQDGNGDESGAGADNVSIVSKSSTSRPSSPMVLVT